MDNKQVTAEWIAQQRALCNAATPGPWNHSDWGSVLAFTDCEVCQNAVDADMTFISAARTAMPAAIDALEAAYAEIERLKDSLGRHVQAEIGVSMSLSEFFPDHGEDHERIIIAAAKASTEIARLIAERDSAVCDMFGCMSTQGQCVRCKKRYYCDGTDDDKFSPLCKTNGHCYAWEWRGPYADNTDAPTGAESEGTNE